MAKRKETLKLYSYAETDENQPEWEALRVPSTKIEQISDDLNNIFEQGIQGALTDLLSRDFIYPDKLPGLDQYYVRPVIEVLFFEHPHLFYELVQALLASQDDNLFHEFESSMLNSDINPADLFAWNDVMKLKLDKDRMALEQYGHDLVKKGANAKGKCLLKMAADLYGLLSPENAPATEGEMTPANKLEILSFKCCWLIRLYRDENQLKDVRGYKKILANVMSALFLFIPNVLNYMVTRNFFFANKTTSQEKMETAAQHVGIKGLKIYTNAVVDDKAVSEEKIDVIAAFAAYNRR
ncbi:MAG: hypothetical protein P4M14_11885 [Gammaproteobacteria bacterium]|nr:hypothetical protein [Gammaproteobacteria bacterium]